MYDIFVNELPPLELTVIDDTGGSGDFMARWDESASMLSMTKWML